MRVDSEFFSQSLKKVIRGKKIRLIILKGKTFLIFISIPLLVVLLRDLGVLQANSSDPSVQSNSPSQIK